ncbi:MAG: exodeoxyribonuclease VII small subunit [Gammaproteobacteria bacterium]
MAKKDTDKNTVTSVVDENAEPMRFESALEELETLVERMEGGDLSLEDSVTCFERGMTLHKFCQNALEQAHQKVDILMQNMNDPSKDKLTPFDTGSNADANTTRAK